MPLISRRLATGSHAKGGKMAFVSPALRTLVVAGACLIAVRAVDLSAQAPDAMAVLDKTIAAAEDNLRLGERQTAESHYRTALLQAWMILGAVHVSSGRLAEARDAFERASTAAVENGVALQSLATVQLQMGDGAPAVEILTKMTTASPRDVRLRLTLAQALVATGKPAEAAQELDEAQAAASADPELLFALASGYLRVKKPDVAETLLARVVAARPLPETYVLIGRTYRDFQYYDRARQALNRALKMDPRVRRAHYYLGTAAILEEGVVRLDEAITEFRKELTITPGDPLATLRLGVVLTEARRYDEALPLLQSAIKVATPSYDAWLYLGRCQLASGRAPEAVVSLRRALELAERPEASSGSAAVRRRSVHYQLATALRATGATDEAQRQFAEAERLSVQQAESERDLLSKFMTDTLEQGSSTERTLPLSIAGFETLTDTQRSELQVRLKATLARTYLNLGIVHAQSSRFARAAELFDMSAQIDPDFPQVQYSLGVAYFNAEEFKKAIPPLTRASEQQPQNAEARRMLAMASFNADDYAKAADLLRTDPKLPSDPALQYAFGLALVRSDRAKEAETIFSRVLTQYPDVPELNVVVGQIHAAQGDYDAAIASLRRAIELKRDVAEAHAALGDIYMRQGNLGAAASSLRDELAAHPRNVRARQTLATVLDLDGRADEAIKELRAIVAVRPTYADARYLFGKILLARGATAEALDHLEVAARLAPEDANIHYQLGQAYQRLGRAEPAAREFEIYKRLKDKQRGGLPS
jgi:tetratricopeptide (TPR) repeat protein